MKECVMCKIDISNQIEYRGKFCVKCDNIKKWNRKKELIKNPELKNIKNEVNISEKECKKCNTLLSIEKFRKKHENTFSSICRDCENIQRKEYYYNNLDKEKERVVTYIKNNKNKVLKAKRINRQKRYDNDPNYKLESLIRSRFRHALKDKKNKKNSTFKYLGCTIQEVKDWLSYNFKEGMTWENHGTKWHIDHIIPCASFDFTEENNIYKCFHWSNLAPLECSENIKKSDKINEEIITYYKKRKNEYINSLAKHTYALEPLDTKLDGKPFDGTE